MRAGQQAVLRSAARHVIQRDGAVACAEERLHTGDGARRFTAEQQSKGGGGGTNYFKPYA